MRRTTDDKTIQDTARKAKASDIEILELFNRIDNNIVGS